jgi:hypothetical protein
MKTTPFFDLQHFPYVLHWPDLFGESENTLVPKKPSFNVAHFPTRSLFSAVHCFAISTITDIL